MEHEVIAERDGVVAQLEVEVGDTVDEGQLLAVIAPGDPAQTGTDDAVGETDLTATTRGPRSRHRPPCD